MVLTRLAKSSKFGPSDLHLRFPSTIDERAEHEFMPVPFPRTEPDPIDLTGENWTPPPRQRLGLRKRTRTPTLDVVEFAAEEEVEEEVLGNDETENEQAHDLPIIEEAITEEEEEENDTELPEIPLDYQHDLLGEDLPDVPELDCLDDDEWESDADNVASRTWEFLRPQSPQHEEPYTPPVLSRPLGLSSPIDRSLFLRSPSPLSLSPSSASSSSGSRPTSPATPPSSSPISRVSRLPTRSRSPSIRGKGSADIRLSWGGVPQNLFDTFLGAEKEYRRLRSLVESPSLFEEEMYDSDATVRPSKHSRSRSRTSRWEREQVRLAAV